jgi:hypothetical protein
MRIKKASPINRGGFFCDPVDTVFDILLLVTYANLLRCAYYAIFYLIFRYGLIFKANTIII